MRRIAISGAVLALATHGYGDGEHPRAWPGTGRSCALSTRGPADQSIEKRIDRLILQDDDRREAAACAALRRSVTDADAKAGVGGVFSLTGLAKINHLQKVAVEQSRLHIPILRPRHHPRLPHGLPGAAGRGEPVWTPTSRASTRGRGPRVGHRRHRAGLQPDGDVRTSPLGSHRRGTGRTPRLGSVMAAARVKGRAGQG